LPVVDVELELRGVGLDGHMQTPMAVGDDGCSPRGGSVPPRALGAATPSRPSAGLGVLDEADRPLGLGGPGDVVLGGGDELQDVGLAQALAPELERDGMAELNEHVGSLMVM